MYLNASTPIVCRDLSFRYKQKTRLVVCRGQI